MLSKYLTFSISITFISFIVGMIVNAGLKKTDFYQQKLSNLNFITSNPLNNLLGVNVVKWMVINTPFKFFNQKIKLTGRFERKDLVSIRNEMTSSEIDHLIGFIFVAIFAAFKCYKSEFIFSLVIMLINIVMNLHPSLIQQQNKRRIDKLIR